MKLTCMHAQPSTPALPEPHSPANHTPEAITVSCVLIPCPSISLPVPQGSAANEGGVFQTRLQLRPAEHVHREDKIGVRERGGGGETEIERERGGEQG